MKYNLFAAGLILFITLSSCDNLVNPTSNIKYSHGVVFESYQNGKSDIYIMDLDGSNLFNLTNKLPGNYFNPDATVNNSNIVFESHWHSNPNSSLPYDKSKIYSINKDDKKINCLSISDHDLSPLISPDGLKIAFGSITNRSCDIYIMDSNGSNKQRLTYSGASGNLEFSPDGLKLLYVGVTAESSYIYVMNTDGSDKLRLRLTYTGLSSSPKFSPDGSKIIYESYDPNQKSREIYSMSIDGSNVRNLTDNQKKNFYPAYSPDGTKIVFVTERDKFLEIFIMKADGNNCTKLTGNSLHYSPKFSSDGHYIFFYSYDNYSQMFIYRMNIDGSNKMKLHAGQNFDLF